MTWGARGQNCRASKLNDEKVRSIKVALKEGATDEELALEYSVSKSTIYSIRTGHSWSHVKVNV